MPPPTQPLIARYQRHRRAWEVGLWAAWWLLNAVANSIVTSLDLERRQIAFQPWEPWTWELSSAVMIFAILPAVLTFERRFPFHFGTWRKVLPWHVLGSVAFSVAHVVGMVGIRKLVYAEMGERYDFGNVPREMFYEFLKDARTYIGILVVVYFYRLLLLRLQGEARLLAAPDAGPPMEAVERPERFLVRKLGSEFLVPARDIEWLEAAENYVNLHVRGHIYPLRSTMTAISARLDPQRFVRVHRSYIVNLDFLVQIEPLDTGDARLLMKDGSRVPCSRRYRHALRGEDR